MKRSITLLTLLLLVACSPTTTPQTAVTPEPTAITSLPSSTSAQEPSLPEPEQPTAVPAESEPTDTATATTLSASVPPTEEPAIIPTEAAETGVVYGRTPEGAFFQGFANAPITLIDYSDFL